MNTDPKRKLRRGDYNRAKRQMKPGRLSASNMSAPVGVPAALARFWLALRNRPWPGV